MTNILTTEKSLENTASAFSDTLTKHKNTPTLILLAGGSALKALEYVDTTPINEYTTIMMMDERFTNSALENNFLQMTKTSFYTKLSNSGCNFIPSVPYAGESHDEFSIRLETLLKKYLTNNPKATVVALFGIGPDGHTGAIFPMDQKKFIDTYEQGNLYTKVTYKKNPFPLRSSITPKFIEQYIQNSFVYAVGKEKASILKTLNNSHELHEVPAYIHTQIKSKIFTDIVI